MTFDGTHDSNCFMSEFSSLALSEVYDLLAAYTASYTKLLPANYWPSPEFLYNREIIERLQKEIQIRTNKVEIEPEGSVEPSTPWNENSH
jgi:hypothetical protein